MFPIPPPFLQSGPHVVTVVERFSNILQSDSREKKTCSKMLNDFTQRNFAGSLYLY